MGRMVRTCPSQCFFEGPQRQLPAMERSVQCSLNQARCNRDEIKEGAGSPGDGERSDACAITGIESSGPPDHSPRQFWRVPRRREDFHGRPFEFAESPEVGGAAVRGHTPRGQAGRQNVPLEARPGPGHDVYAPVELPERTVAHGIFELTLTQPRVKPLGPRQEPVLPRREGQQGGHDRGGRRDPERITHRICGLSARGSRCRRVGTWSRPPMQAQWAAVTLVNFATAGWRGSHRRGRRGCRC